jgi:hypothetical protein
MFSLRPWLAVGPRRLKRLRAGLPKSDEATRSENRERGEARRAPADEQVPLRVAGGTTVGGGRAGAAELRRIWGFSIPQKSSGVRAP